jgi:hypothetical protein
MPRALLRKYCPVLRQNLVTIDIVDFLQPSATLYWYKGIIWRGIKAHERLADSLERIEEIIRREGRRACDRPRLCALPCSCSFEELGACEVWAKML